MKRTLILGLIGLCLSVSAAQKKNNLKDLPPPVQQAIQRATGQGPIESVKKLREDDRAVYEVHYKQRGVNKQIVLAEDGTVLRESNLGRGKGKNDHGNKKAKPDKSRGGQDDSEEEQAPKPASVPTARPLPAPTPIPVPAPAPAPIPTGRTPQAAKPAATPAPTPSAPVPVPRGPVHVAWNDLPEKVQQAVVNQKGLGSVRLVRKETRVGKTLYHAHFEKGIASYTPEGEMADANSFWK